MKCCFCSESSLGQCCKYFIHEVTLRKNHIPGSEEQDHTVRIKMLVLLVPYFQGAFIGQNHIAVTFLWRKFALRNDQFFIPENNGTNSGTFDFISSE